MQTVLIVIHLMIVLALVGVVLLQRSEGGGLGIGGGGGGFMTARGAANALTRATAILAAGFFATSLLLSIMARYGEKPTDILDRVPGATQGQGNGVLDQLGGQPAAPAAPAEDGAQPAVPATGDPAAPATGGAAAPAAGNSPAPATGTQVPNSQ
jgi:preprotein translocase subunit SecG